MSKVTDYINNEAVISFTSETAFTLPSYNTRSSLTLKNLSAPDLTVTAAGTELIDGNATYVVGGNSTAKIIKGEAGWVVVEGSDSSITGILTVSNATESSSVATGAIVTAGGIGAAKQIFAAGFNTAGGKINYNVSSQGVGSVYSLTNTSAKVNLGTTDPVIVLDKAGTYLVMAQIQLTYTGATVVAETAAVKVRRTNNTAADASVELVIDLPVSVTLTNTYGIVPLAPFIYTTANVDDSLEIFANVSAALGAGTIDATAVGTSITAVRLY